MVVGEEMRAERARRARRERRVKAAVCTLFAAAVVAGVAWLAVAEGGFRQPDADAPAAGSSPQVEMQEVTDSTGRVVEVPAEPHSIAVMDPFSGELAVMAGAGPQLCGVPGGVASDAVLQSIYPDLATAPVALSGNVVNIETLAELSCDVAVVKSTLSDDERAKLDRVGIPYVVIDYTTMEEQIAAMRLVGAVCGSAAQQKADALAAYYEQTISMVEARTAQIPESQRVSVYHAINDILLTDGSESLGADWISRVGCTDVSATQKATSGSDYDATLEQVYTWNPDALICNVAQTASSVASDAKWAGLGAVADGRVHVIPTGATRWGQRGDVETYLAMLWLGCTVYPQYYSDINLKQTVVDYYRDYLGIDVSDQLYAEMMSGKGIRSSGGGSGGGGGGDGSGAGSGGGSGHGGGDRGGSGGGRGAGDGSGR